jgi:hypothetical protein
MNGFLKIGDHVCWESSAAGGTTTKHGIVRIVVPLGFAPRILIESVVKSVGDKKKLNARPVRGAEDLKRNHESYVIEVRNKIRGSKLYWPLVSLLSQTPGPVGIEEKSAALC